MALLEFDDEPANRAKIKVIGVGGGGGNAINTMIEARLEGVDFIVANTDIQALESNQAPMKIALGEMADAKQPTDKNRQPVRKTPRYIPPTVPASSAPGWLVKCRTMNRHASIGSHVTM